MIQAPFPRPKEQRPESEPAITPREKRVLLVVRRALLLVLAAINSELGISDGK